MRYKKYNLIHLWDFPLTHLSLKLKSKFKKDFIVKINEYFENFKNAAEFLSSKQQKYNRNLRFNSLYSTLRKFKVSDCFLPAWTITELVKLFRLENNLENNIDASMSFYGRIFITKPKLPILITPEFDSIFVHLCCDGSIEEKSKIVKYSQRNFTSVQKFYEKITNIFGKVSQIRKSKEGKWYLILPVVIGRLYKKYYSLPSFNSFKARIPSAIKQKSKEFKVAVLSAFLVDEGNIEDSLSFRVMNKDLLNDIREIVISLGYKCSKITPRKHWTGKKIYGFYINTSSIPKFLNDIKELSKEFPTCDLSIKQKNLEKFKERVNRGTRKLNKNNIRELILKSIRKGMVTSNEITKEINISRSMIRKYLKELEMKNIINKMKKGKGYVWNLS